MRIGRSPRKWHEGYVDCCIYQFGHNDGIVDQGFLVGVMCRVAPESYNSEVVSFVGTRGVATYACAVGPGKVWGATAPSGISSSTGHLHPWHLIEVGVIVVIPVRELG